MFAWEAPWARHKSRPITNKHPQDQAIEGLARPGHKARRILQTEYPDLEGWVDAADPENAKRMDELYTIHAEWEADQWVIEANTNNTRSGAFNDGIIP